MIGGDVLKRKKLRLLTARCDVGASREIIPGLYEVLGQGEGTSGVAGQKNCTAAA